MAKAERSLEELSPEKCEQLLASHQFGRLAIVVDGQPFVFPVNYLFANGRLVIRTDPGLKLTGGTLGDVAFEIDAVDEVDQTGWSVHVQGFGQDVTDSIDLVSETLRQLPLDPWVGGERAHFLRIEPRRVTGRRLVSRER